MTSPINPDHVCIVGDINPKGAFGLKSGILISTDAGDTWQEPFGNWDSNGPTNTFHEVWFLDSINIWAVGNNGWVVKSTGGGTAFQGTGAIIEGGDWIGTRTIHVTDSQTAVVAGSKVDVTGAQESRVWKTTNGGLNWTALNQAPNYYSVPTAPDMRNAYGYPVSNNPNPVGLSLISGGAGYVSGTGIPCVSNGTGKDLTIDITAVAGVITSFVINNEGRDFNVGEIVTVTTGGGNATLSVTAIEPAFPIGIPQGIWMSRDEMTIVVTTNYTQQVSIDGGLNFITAGPQIIRAGFHLTWYPSHEWQNGLPTRMRHVGGFGQGAEVVETLDLGTNWTIERQNTGVHMLGAHFYSPQNGYYTDSYKLFRTSNGGVTGMEVLSDPGFATWQAIWTQEPNIIYRLIDCSGQANDQFVSDPNMANYVGQVIQIVAPDADLPADLCWQVEEYDDFHLTYDDPVPVLGSFATCLECDPNYYKLTDCEGNEAPIYTTTDLSQYVPVAGAKINAVALILTPCCGGTVYETALIPNQSPQCTNWEITIPTDSPAGTIDYTDCDGVAQSISYPAVIPPITEALVFDICVLDGTTINTTGIVVQQTDCSPPPPPQPTWPDLNGNDQVVIWDDGTGEKCYGVTSIVIPFTITQPAGYIDTPVDAEVTVLNSTNCVDAALENPICECDTPEPVNYPGNVIQIEECPNVCWTVEEIEPDTTLELTDVTVTEDYVDCEDCLPKEPIKPIIIRNRKVKPGYDTPGCPPEYFQKVSCSFAEALYREVVNKRYGIEVCCDEEDDRWLIQKWLLDLKAIFDPEACESIVPDACCPPCNVSSVLTVYQTMDCLPPIDVTSELLWPQPCLPPIDVNSELKQEPKCVQFRITVPPLIADGSTLQYVDCFGQLRYQTYPLSKVTKQFLVCALETPAPTPTNCTVVQTGGSCT
jgi:photosystem II stability/assembly factor-like uncharacterized protein